uniref:OmpA family protein n=1 Tax=Flavobacterium sp. TaxID=239 RepID=UPI00404ACAC6
MRYVILFIGFLFLTKLSAQEEEVSSVYFAFDKFNIIKPEANKIVQFVQQKDSAKIASVEIFGYCDDRGKDDYNIKLSNKRANAVKDLLVKNGITNKIIITIEGKGRILIDDDIVENLPEARSKNRRVDVVINFIPPPAIEEEPGIHKSIKKDHVVGDRVYLENLYFDRGSSKLTFQAKKELDKIIKLMNRYKNYHFEIQGHVCCTPTYHKEAIDMQTKKRELSKNRALAVYKYLIFKKVNKNRLTHKGYGNTQPLGKDPTQDRRVELVITKK